MTNPVEKSVYGICGIGSTTFFTGSDGTVLQTTSRGLESIGPVPRTTSLRACAGDSRDVLWVFGDGGKIASYNRGAWSEESAVTLSSLRATWGGWVVGSRGTILHNVVGWRDADSGTEEDLSGVWGYTSSGVTWVYAVGALGTVVRRHD